MAGTVSAPAALAASNRYPDELEAAALEVAVRLEALEVAAADAERIGWEIAEHLRRFWGGRNAYVRAPQGAPDTRQLGLLDGGDAAGTEPDSEILADLAEQVEERLVGIGLAHDEAARMGLAVAQHMNAYWGSGPLYICKGRYYEISLRDQEIFNRFRNGNYEWLAREYNLTVQHVYRVVKRVGAAERAKRQSQMFPGSNAG